MASEANQSSPFGVSLQVALAAAPGVGYGGAFLFRWGYARYFEIPVELIILDFTDVVYAALIVAGVIILTAAVAGPLAMEAYGQVEASQSLLAQFVRRAIRNLIIGLGFVLLGNVEGKDEWLVLGMAVLLAVMGTALEVGSSASSNRASTAIVALLRPQLVRVSGWLVLLALLVYLGGWSRASNQHAFFVDRNDPKKVLLAIYGHDSAVFGRLSREGGPLIKGTIEVRELKDPDVALRRVYFSSLG
jgi:hypothetical protein